VLVDTWQVTRYSFYGTTTVVLLVSAVYVSVVVMWISLGLLVSPARFSSIAGAIYGLVIICLRYWSKSR